MQQRVLRRTSLGGSNSSLRRSSISSKDIQALQTALAKYQDFSTPAILGLIVALPTFSYFYLLLVYQHHGSLSSLFSSLLKLPSFAGAEQLLFDLTAWKFTLVFLSVQLILHWVLPHDNVYLLSSAGDQKKPVNSFSSCLLICLLYVMGSGLGMYREDLLFIHFSSIIICFSIVCVVVLIFMLINYRLGEFYNVTTVSEFCFGVELHPSILDIDIKHFVRSRITLVIWPLFIISAICYQRNVYGTISLRWPLRGLRDVAYDYQSRIDKHLSHTDDCPQSGHSRETERSLLASGIVQMIYIIKYHWTEYLALNSLDYKRANCGFYKLWSDMVLFPTLYCSSIAMIAHTHKSISLLLCCVLSVAAMVSIYMTTIIDKQKYDFRRSKGIIKICGVDPFFITAKYKDDKGDTAANLLLGSGYWALCRHPNYTYEAATFVIFSAFQGPWPVICHLPALFVAGYLFIRQINDESRCMVKYGQCWMQYCNKVPFRLVPGLY